MNNIADIDFAIGSVNPSGIHETLFCILKKDIATWPTITDDYDEAAAITDYVNLTGDFTLAAGKKWTRLYSTQGKGKLTSEPQGETDCKVLLNKAEFKYPKLTDEIRSFAKLALNGDMVFVAKHDGKYFVIGSPDYRTVVSSSANSGDSAGSDKGVTISVECPDVTPLPKYVGDLLLSDGTLDCSTGTFTPTQTP